MIYKTLQELIDLKIFENKRTSIIESEFQNVDFLIREISKTFKNVEIVSFYQTNEHYNSIIGDKHINGNNIKIKSYFDNNEFNAEDGNDDVVTIIDDYFTSVKMGEISSKYIQRKSTVFFIFRSNTFKQINLYLSDFQIEITPIESGVSNRIDGKIKIYNREKTLLDVKYKVKPRETLFLI